MDAYRNRGLCDTLIWKILDAGHGSAGARRPGNLRTHVQGVFFKMTLPTLATIVTLRDGAILSGPKQW